MLRQTKPKNPDILWDFIDYFYNLQIPRVAVCENHVAPFDYVSDAFFEKSGDCLVWANRGGGKTENGAVLTHLDAIFRKGCSIRILGGSLDQSLKMYKYLRRKWDSGFEDFLAKDPMRRETILLNGSTIEVLTQSTRSVRGPHVHRIRCDEIDEFSAEVWSAVQFATSSSEGISTHLEGLSTMHKPYGLFQEAIDSKAYKTYPYCVWETVERCKDRSCSRCELNPVCQGRAKKATGFIPISDLISIFSRASTEAWEAEEECKRPSYEGRVYKDFIDKPEEEGGHLCQEFKELPSPGPWEFSLAIDWGSASPFVCLLIARNIKEDRDYIVREHASRDMLLREHAQIIKSWAPIDTYALIVADPKGRTERKEFRALGIPTKAPKADITGGIELVRRRLKRRSSDGKPSIVVAPSCIFTRKEFMKYCYHKAKDGKVSELPRDAYNHAMDAYRNYCLKREKKGITVGTA